MGEKKKKSRLRKGASREKGGISKEEVTKDNTVETPPGTPSADKQSVRKKKGKKKNKEEKTKEEPTIDTGANTGAKPEEATARAKKDDMKVSVARKKRSKDSTAFKKDKEEVKEGEILNPDDKKSENHTNETTDDKRSTDDKKSTDDGVSPAQCEAKTQMLSTISRAKSSSTDDTAKKELESQLSVNAFYHGLMPREEIEELLMDDGQFLVRKTEVDGKPRYCVSVMNKGRIRHILLNYQDGKWYLKDLRKDSLLELINEHVETKTPVMKDGTFLLTAVSRPSYSILHDHVEVGKKLGGGAFGDVHIGKLKLDGETIDVAIKKMKNSVGKKQRSEFVKEAKLMRRFNHPNIVRMIGIAAQQEPILIMLELASGGGLNSKLKKHPDMEKSTLLKYTVDACRGLCYLSGRKLIHRDIAARNCLLGKNDEVKISDFGLSVADKNTFKLNVLKHMPIRWLSPEVFARGEFSTKSDVWSYGVLIWEIYSCCKSDPFPGLTNGEAKAKIMSKEQPMQAPEGAQEIIKNVMMLCFTQDPDARPDFSTLFTLLAPKETAPPPPIVMPNFETY